jgi:putative ABC transport system permease protein
MNLIPYLRSLGTRFFRRAKMDRELEEELAAHIRLHADRLEGSGLPRAEAERQARIEFGSQQRFKTECREALGGNFLDMLIQDFRFGARMLRKSPAFSFVAITTLAVGIGGAIAAFSVVNTVLLRPFAFRDPGKLLWIYSRLPDNPRANFSLPEYCDYRDQQTLFEGLLAVSSYNASLSESGEARRVQGVRMTANAFGILGVRPLLGRVLIAEDDRNGAAPVLLISYGLWSRQYAEDRNVLGRSVSLDGQLREIVGVLPPSFALPNLDTDFVVPLQPDSDPRRNERNSVNFLRMIGRPKPNVTVQQVHAELESIRKNLRRQYPEAYAWKVGTTIVPLTEEIVTNVRAVLLTIFCAAGALLLVGCTNLAGISLSRAAARQQELAVRTALGATRGQLTRLLLTESFILATIGGSLGVLLETWGRGALLRLVPADLPRISSFSVDSAVLIFAGAATLVAAVFCGLAPAWLLSRVDLRGAMVSSGRGSTGGKVHSRLRTWLVGGQIALALVLLANAGVLFRSFARVRGEQPGFDSTGVITARLSLPQVGYPDRAAMLQLYEKVRSRIAEAPGVENVGMISILPLTPKSIAFIHFSRPDAPSVRPEDRPSTNYRIISPDYFRAMGIPLLSGRYFTETDDGDRAPVAIVSSVLARNHFPDRSPIGQQILIDDTAGEPRAVEIVGVVGPVKMANLETAPRGDLYLPLRQMPPDQLPWLRGSTYWVVKTKPGASNVESLLRGAIRNIDGNVAVASVRPMDQVVRAALAARRFSLLLIGSFAVAAIFLAAAGLYAVIAYGIQQRTREIGVRLALGATRASILRMIFREGGVLLMAGVTAGLAVALAMAKLIANQMYGVSARDPVSFTLVSLLVALILLLACGIAARRATRVDPMMALRCE